MSMTTEQVWEAFHTSLQGLIITHIFWDTFTGHGDEPSRIEEIIYDLCFGVPLYRRLQKLVGNDKLQGFIRNRVPDDATADDLLQEVFLKIHQHIGMLKDTKKVESWVYQIARHTIIDYYRNAVSTTTLEVSEVLSLANELPDDNVVSELFPCVQAMVRNLPHQAGQSHLNFEHYPSFMRKQASCVGHHFHRGFSHQASSHLEN